MGGGGKGQVLTRGGVFGKSGKTCEKKKKVGRSWGPRILSKLRGKGKGACGKEMEKSKRKVAKKEERNPRPKSSQKKKSNGPAGVHVQDDRGLPVKGEDRKKGEKANPFENRQRPKSWRGTPKKKVEDWALGAAGLPGGRALNA